MSESQPANVPAAWRTVMLTGGVVLLQTLAYGLGTWKGWSNEGAAAYSSLCMWSTVAACGVAAKALGEHLGSGSGWKGAVSALMSDTKPGEPAP